MKLITERDVVRGSSEIIDQHVIGTNLIRHRRHGARLDCISEIIHTHTRQ